jgi:ubiquinone/menaquinone biosynthesis C-methylase UbiE
MLTKRGPKIDYREKKYEFAQVVSHFNTTKGRRSQPMAYDPSTLAYYDQQARLYPKLRARPVQLYTEKLEREIIAPYLQGATRVLDLGCGEGRIARWMAEEARAAGHALEIHASDFSGEMVAIARRLSPNLPITYFVDDATAMKVAENSYDLIVSSTAPNNFPSIRAAVSEIHRILAPGGVFIGVIINKDELAQYARYVYLFPYYLFRMLCPVSHGWVRTRYSRTQIETLFSTRFEIVELRGLRVLPDFIPEFPFNFWRPLFPLTNAAIRGLARADRRLAASARFRGRARFHVIVARVRK